MKKVSFVIPAMNEAENIPLLYDQIIKNFPKRKYHYELIFVCDPSTDGTELEVESLRKRDKRVILVQTADRAGQAECIRIGYDYCTGDAVISMDADFQDPPDLIPAFLSSWELGFQIVHSERSSRKSDKLFYRLLMGFGYKVLGKLTSGKIQHHVGDYRLLDIEALGVIKQFRDPKPFWRGITSLNGMRTSTISYTRPERKFGNTKYSNWIGSPVFALRGLASFSLKPLHFLQILGGVSVFFCLLAFLIIGVIFIRDPQFPRGVPTLIVLVTGFFAVQFLSTAIIASYLLVLVEQTRKRPNYFIKKK